MFTIFFIQFSSNLHIHSLPSPGKTEVCLGFILSNTPSHSMTEQWKAFLVSGLSDGDPAGQGFLWVWMRIYIISALHTHGHTHGHTHAHILMYTRTHIPTYVRTAHSCTYMHIYTRVHMYTHVCTNAYTYIVLLEL